MSLIGRCLAHIVVRGHVETRCCYLMKLCFDGLSASYCKVLVMMYNIRIQSSSRGLCPSCNRHVNTKTLSFNVHTVHID
jgi:hypothetical protein